MNNYPQQTPTPTPTPIYQETNINNEKPPPYEYSPQHNQQTYLRETHPPVYGSNDDEQNANRKVRTIVPFIFFDIDITDFPFIKILCD
jgi:hypothetical protein